MDFQFSPIEAMFYAASFVASGLASFARILRDNEPLVPRVVFGRCLSSGFLSFGIVAIWVGRSADTSSFGSFGWLAVAALIGYLSKDIQDQILTRASHWLLKKFGPDDVGK